MESLNSVDALNENQIDNIDQNAVALKNKVIDNDVVEKKADIIATAKYDPEEENVEETKVESNEKDELNESVNTENKNQDNLEKEKPIDNTNNVDKESNDNSTDVNEGNLIQNNLNKSSESQDFKECIDLEKEEKKENDKEEEEEGEEEEEEEEEKENEKEKEEQENESDTNLDLPQENSIKKSRSIGGSENILVNKILISVQEEAYKSGSMDSLARKKMHMNKKFQELRDSQANLNKVMSTDKKEHFTMKSAKGLSDDAVNKLAKSSEYVDDDTYSSDEETQSEGDETFDVDRIRKFEKRNTIHVPLHKGNYANINSASLKPEFESININDGIENIVSELFEIIEDNVRPIMQVDGLSKMFIKNLGATKEEDVPDFDITTISEEVGKLIVNQQYEDAYNLIVLKVNNNYRVQICEEIITTINSIVVLFCLNENVQNSFKSYYTENYDKLKRNSLLEIMNSVDIISPPERIVLGYCLYYLIHSKNKKLAPEAYKELSAALTKNQDYSYSLTVLNDMGRQHWDKKTYQNALDLCIKMKPQKLEYAESLLNDYGQPYIVAKNENSLVPIIISTPLMIGTTRQDIKEMRNYYKELLRVFKWKMALENFETAKDAIYTKKEMLQLKNAMLELCVTYKEFQHGWSIFQGMTECNKNTAQVAITLCREAINFNNGVDEQDTYRIGWVNRAWDIVISLKDWAIYNMPNLVGKKSKAAIRKNKRNVIIIPECVQNKLKDYKRDSRSNEDETGGDSKENTVDISKRKKSMFKSSKPVELPSHLAKSNFNLVNIDRNSMVSIIAFVFHEILCIFETVPNMEIFLLHLVEIYNFLYENSINEILCDEYMIRPIIRFCLKCRLGEKYKKFNFNNIQKEESFMKERGVKFSNQSKDGDMNDDEIKFNMERMNRRGRCMSINKNQQMNDILYEHIKNNIKKREEESTPEDPEFEREKNKICTRIALDCYYNICGGSSEKEVKKCHSNTYAMILHFAILERNAKLFEDICNDLWYARIQLDEEVVMALQLFHDNHLEACSSCSEKDHFYSSEVTVQPYKYEKQKFIVLNGIRMRTPLDLSFLKKIGTINGRPYSQEEARKFLNHCINQCNPKRRLSMSI